MCEWQGRGAHGFWLKYSELGAAFAQCDGCAGQGRLSRQGVKGQREGMDDPLAHLPSHHPMGPSMELLPSNVAHFHFLYLGSLPTCHFPAGWPSVHPASVHGLASCSPRYVRVLLRIMGAHQPWLGQMVAQARAELVLFPIVGLLAWSLAYMVLT